MLLHYPLKRSVNPAQAALLSDPSRYLPVVITRLRDVDHEDISVYPHVRSVAYVEYGGTIKAPERVTEIEIWYSWNKPLTCDMFPAGLERLRFSDKFNQELKPGVFPSTITGLFLGDSFNMPLSVGVLPASLTELYIGECFRPHIDPGVLPDTLEHLSMGWGNSTHIRLGSLPKRLKHLQAGEGHIDTGALPDSITHLKTESLYPSDMPKLKLSSSLTYLSADDLGIFDDGDFLPR